MTNEKRGLLSGLLYVSLALIGPFAFLVIPSLFIGKGSIDAYAINHMSTVVLWLGLDVLIILVEAALTWNLWKFFNEFNKQLSFIAYVLRLLVIGVMIVNASFLLLIIVNGGSNAETYITFHSVSTYIWQLVFSFHVLILGYLVYSHVLTSWKYLGVIVMIGSVGYFVDSINYLLSIDSGFMPLLGMVLLIFVTIGEIGMALGLILRKVIPA